MNGAGMLENVAVVHIDAPGHEDETSLVNVSEMNLELLAQQLSKVLVDIGTDKFIGIGIGAGANVLLRYASVHPSKGNSFVDKF
jgi:pimeloyl-ACP methyl ester carboxylesterase